MEYLLDANMFPIHAYKKLSTVMTLFPFSISNEVKWIELYIASDDIDWNAVGMERTRCSGKLPCRYIRKLYRTLRRFCQWTYTRKSTGDFVSSLLLFSCSWILIHHALILIYRMELLCYSLLARTSLEVQSYDWLAHIMYLHLWSL